MPDKKNSAVAVLMTTPMAATIMMVLPAGWAGAIRRLTASQPMAPTTPISSRPLNSEAMMVARE